MHGETSQNKPYTFRKEVIQMTGTDAEKNAAEQGRPMLETTVEFNGRGMTLEAIDKCRATPALLGDLPSRIVEAILASAAEQLRVQDWPKVIWKEAWGNWPNAL